MSRVSMPDWPRMMRRALAAAYCDLSVAEFEREMASGNVPLPIRLGGGERWSRAQLDSYLDRLTGDAVPDWRARAPHYAQR